MFDDAAAGSAESLRLKAAALAALDPSDIDDAGLLDGLTEMLAAEAALRAAQARWLRAARDRQVSVTERGRTTRSWLIEEQHLSPADASRRLKLATLLTDAPATEAMLAAGQITAEHALDIATCLHDADPASRKELEAALLDLARIADPATMRRAVDAIQVRLGLSKTADEAYARRMTSRGVTASVTFGGFASLSGTLTPDAAQLLQSALAAAGADTVGAEDRRSAAQRRHDALAEIAAFYVAHPDQTDNGTERPRVIVTIPLDHLRDELGRAGHATLGDNGQPLPATVARRLACDAQIIPAVLGSRGEILDLGRATRVFPAAIRRAARLRQSGRCAFPGCQRPIRELHHIDWYSHGGSTSLDNAAWLCSFHHWLVHDGGWHFHSQADGTHVFTGPTGREFRADQQPRAG